MRLLGAVMAAAILLASCGEAEQRPSSELQNAGSTAALRETQTLETYRTTVDLTPARVIESPPVGEYDKPPSGTRFVGVELEIENQGNEPFGSGSALAGAVLVDSRDFTAQPAVASEGPCGTTVDLLVSPGDRRNLCLLFSVDHRAEPRLLQYTVDAGDGDTNTAEWELGA